MAGNRGYDYVATGDSEGIMIYNFGGFRCSSDLEMDSRTWTLYSKNSVSSPTSLAPVDFGSPTNFLFNNNGKYVKYDLNKVVAT